MPAIKKKKHDPEKSKTKIFSQNKVKEAVHALKLLNKKFVEEDLKKQPLLEDTAESPIYLQLMLKKIPPPQLIKMIRIPLPHSLITETTEVCLITGDLEKRNHKAEIEPTVLHYKDLLRKQGVTKVSQVIPLRQLRTEYKTFESRRQLAAAYDVFLADKKIAGVLPKALGKSFFKDRKFPIQIDMKRPNLKDQIDKALSQTEFSLTCRGNSYALEIARLSMEDDAIMENVKTSIEVLGNKLPGNEDNILSLYIKTAKSKAIPIYVSLDISDDLVIKKPRKNNKFKLDELSTMDDAEVKVFRDGRVVLRKMKKESISNENASQDDKNMDLNEPFSDELMENEDTQESTTVEVSLKKKEKSYDLTEITDNAESKNEEDLQDSVANQSSAKKKKKSKKAAKLDPTENSDLIEIIDLAEMENPIDPQDTVANKFSAKKKRTSRKAAELEGVMSNDEMESVEDNQDSIANQVQKKSKRGKKSTCLNQVEDIQNSFIMDISPKNKKKGKNIIADHVLDSGGMKTEEDIQKSPSSEASPKKKNKKNMNASHIEADETIEEVRENSILLNYKKRKIHEDIVNEEAQKFKSRKTSESEDNDEIEKVVKSKKHKNISEIAEEIFVETTPKSIKEKKSKAGAKLESSLISVDEIMHYEKIPLKSKKALKESTDLTTGDTLISKRKKANMDNNVKTNSELKKQKSDRNSLSIPLKTKKIKN